MTNKLDRVEWQMEREEHGVMISPRTRSALIFAFVSALTLLNGVPTFAVSAKSQVIVRELRSENIAHNKAGTDPVRKMLVYLPAGYDESSSQRYPVIYFLPNPFEDSYRFEFDHKDAQSLFDHAIAERVIEEFILVAVDMNTPLGTSWYVNSPATGDWEDFMIRELVPYIDANFKTLRNRDSRGIAGISSEDTELSASVCAIRMSLALCMPCIQWGRGQV